MDYQRVVGGSVGRNPSIYPRTPTATASQFTSDLMQGQPFVSNQPRSPIAFEREDLEAPGSKRKTKINWQPTLSKEQSSKQKYEYESYLSGQTLTGKKYPPLSSSNFFNLPSDKGVSSRAEWSSDERYRDLFPNYKGHSNCSDPYRSSWPTFPSHPDSRKADSNTQRNGPPDKDPSQSQHSADDSDTGSLFHLPVLQTEPGDVRNGEMTHSVQYDFSQNEWDVQIDESAQIDESVSLNELFQDVDGHSLQTKIQGGTGLNSIIHRLLGSLGEEVKSEEGLCSENGSVHETSPPLPTERHLKPEELGDCSSLTSDEKLLLEMLLSKMNHRTVNTSKSSKQKTSVVKEETDSSDQSQGHVRKRGQEDVMTTDVTKRNHSGESKNVLYASPTPSKQTKLQLERTLKKQKKIQPVTVVNLDSVLQESESIRGQRKECAELMEVEKFNVNSSTTVGELDGTALNADVVTAKRDHQGLKNYTGELETVTQVVKKTKKKKHKKKQGQVCGREMNREEERLLQWTEPVIPKDTETGMQENKEVYTDGDNLVHSSSEQKIDKNVIQSDMSERFNVHSATDEVGHITSQKQSNASVIQRTEASRQSYADTLKTEYSNADTVKKPTKDKHVDSIWQSTNSVTHLMSKQGNSHHKEREELVAINQKLGGGVNESQRSSSVSDSDGKGGSQQGWDTQKKVYVDASVITSPSQNTSQPISTNTNTCGEVGAMPNENRDEGNAEKARTGKSSTQLTVTNIGKGEKNQEEVHTAQVMRHEPTRKERVKGLKGLPLHGASSRVNSSGSHDKQSNKLEKVVKTDPLSEAALPGEPSGEEIGPQKTSKREKKNCNGSKQTGQNKSQSTKGQIDRDSRQVPKSVPMKSRNNLQSDSKSHEKMTTFDKEKAAGCGKASGEIPTGEEKKQDASHSNSNSRGKSRCQKKKHGSPAKTSKPVGEGSSKVKKEMKNGSAAGTPEERDRMKTRKEKRKSINWSVVTRFLPTMQHLQEGTSFVLSITQIVLLCVAAQIVSTIDYFKTLIVALLWDSLALCQTYLPIILSKLLLVKHLWTYVVKPALFITICVIGIVLWGIVKIFLLIRWIAGYKSNSSNQDGQFEEGNGRHQDFQNEQFRHDFGSFGHDKEFPNFGTDRQERFSGSTFRENMKGSGPFPSGHSNSTKQGCQGHVPGNGHFPGSRSNENSSCGNDSHNKSNRSDSSNDAAQVIRRILNASDNPYEVLCVDCDVTQEVIKKEYRRLAVLIHPDKSQHPDAQRAFQKLQAAHELIGDEESRMKYQMDHNYHIFAENLRAECEKQYEELRTSIRCECGQFHKKIRIDRPAYEARFCSIHRTYHAANDNDIWVETSCMGLKIHCFVCENGIVYDVTTWASCQRFIGRIEPNSCKVQVKMAHSRPPPYNLNSDFDDFLRSFGTTPPRGGDSRRNRSSFPNNKKRNKRGGRR